MLNIAHKIVKKGGETVSSAAQAVGVGSAKGRNVDESFDADNMIKNAKAKFELELKSTPSKDALTTSRLACHKGYIVKKNEQGSWQKRYACLVPHTFLYYFDSDISQEPRGVIDLELYNNLSVEGSECNILTMSTSEEGERNQLNSYYFQLDDPNELSEWMTKILRDKFSVIKEERDEYMSLQESFTSTINNSKKANESNAAEKDKMTQEIARLNQINEENTTQIKRLLLRFGISESEMKKLDTGAKICDNIQVQIDKLRDANDKSIKDMRKRELEEKKELEMRIEQLEKNVAQESQSKKALELKYSEQLHDLQAKLEAVVGDMQRAGLNTEMAIAAKAAAEQKSTTLSDQKKILVKEVKQLRTKIDEDKETMAALQATNEKLNAQISSMQERFIQLTNGITKQNERIASSGSIKDDDSTSNSDNDSVGGSGSGNRQSLNQASSFDDKGSSSLLDTISNTFSSSSPATYSPNFSLQSMFKSVDNDVGLDSSTHSEKNNADRSASGDITNEGNTEAGEINKDSSENGIFSFMQSNKQPSSRSSSSSASDFDSKMSQLLANSNESAAKSNRRSSLEMLSSLLSFDKSSSTPAIIAEGGATRDPQKEANLINMYEIYDKNQAVASSNDSIEAHNSMYISPLARSNSNETPGPSDATASSTSSSTSSPSAFKIRCLRCNGTVEGPMYSTCKCTEPALTPEDLKTTSKFSVFGSLFS